MMHDSSHRRNEKGEAYRDKKTKKDNSRGYNNPNGKKGLNAIPGAKETGADTKKGAAYKDKPHKDNSRGARSEDKGRKGLKDAPKGVRSPDGDGRKDNRRVDKAKGYHGRDRGGKDLG